MACRILIVFLLLNLFGLTAQDLSTEKEILHKQKLFVPVGVNVEQPTWDYVTYMRPDSLLYARLQNGDEICLTCPVSQSGGSSDADFYRTGTTAAPTNVLDDLFTMGRLGIGTETLNYAFTISGIGSQYMQFHNALTGATGNDGFFFGLEGNGEATIYQASNAAIKLYTNNVARLTIEGNGATNANNNNITNLADGTASNEAVNKGQLDSQGLPSGGTVGQIPSKVDGTDYNTQWIDPPSGSGLDATNNLTKTAGQLKLEDASQVVFGTANNMVIKHSSGDNVIDLANGDLIVSRSGVPKLRISRSTGDVFVIAGDLTESAFWHGGNDGDGSGLDADLLGGVPSSDIAKPTGAFTKTTGSIKFNDTIQALFGTGNDMRLSHSGGVNYLDLYSGDFYIRRNSTNRYKFGRSTNDFENLLGKIKAQGYQSADGSDGATGSFTAQSGETITVKNGLITGIN